MCACEFMWNNKKAFNFIGRGGYLSIKYYSIYNGKTFPIRSWIYYFLLHIPPGYWDEATAFE